MVIYDQRGMKIRADTIKIQFQHRITMNVTMPLLMSPRL